MEEAKTNHRGARSEILCIHRQCDLPLASHCFSNIHITSTAWVVTKPGNLQLNPKHVYLEVNLIELQSKCGGFTPFSTGSSPNGETLG